MKRVQIEREHTELPAIAHRLRQRMQQQQQQKNNANNNERFKRKIEKSIYRCTIYRVAIYLDVPSRALNRIQWCRIDDFAMCHLPVRTRASLFLCVSPIAWWAHTPTPTLVQHRHIYTQTQTESWSDEIYICVWKKSENDKHSILSAERGARNFKTVKNDLS